MAGKPVPGGDYTLEERMILASLRKTSGRTCASCRWLVEKGQHRGCYPEGKYRKFLSRSEFEAGCDSYAVPDDP
jgi:hypothetical protein